MSDPHEPAWQRHDLHILAAVALLLAIGFAAGARAGQTRQKTIDFEGMTLTAPPSWLAEPLGRRDAGTAILVLRGEDAVTRVELRASSEPAEFVPLDGSLELERGQRYGAMYQRLDSGRRTVAGRDWMRTVYAYAFKPTPTHAPRLAHAVEYAAVSGARLYVVTVHAPEEHIAELERTVLGSLRAR